MKVLAVDTSSVVAGVAVLDDEQLLYEAYNHHRKNHSEILMPLVENALKSCSLTPRDIDLLAVSNGPGSFTGLRIGISTIKGLAQALDKPVAGVPTLDALAYNIISPQALVCPIMDARRDQVYTALYRRDKEDLIRLMPYSAIHISELADRLNEYGEPVIFTGDGILSYKEKLIDSIGELALFAPSYLALQRASVIAWLGRREALNGRTVSCFDLETFYLRQSQAEQMKKRCTGEGI
ncbi:MAG TPA: tRNA (adenosine(37)-N6)-threonylcarbamoyltransferase complex dimerization subunit type 1 TsaB [Clostridiales bacterium]|nr:tRNA (adenosine(37)-N6)-threonylcarbamoyltransferase complex dimerization subunit type 1 TsaB [Clostridiales bacterium]